MFTARQRLPLSAFTYDLIDEACQAIGALCWPGFPVARNAQLKSAVPKSLTTRIRLTCHGLTHDVEYEHLIRDWHNDIWFFLTAGGGTLAAADGIRSANRYARPDLTLTQPLSASLVRSSGFFSTRYALQVAGRTAGVVAEKISLRLRRELVAELPDSLSLPVQCFVMFLVINAAYR